jgi:hypothetical protein
MFAIYAQEKESPWHAGGDEAERALDTLEHNPYAPFEEMQLAVELPWEPYDRVRALKALEEEQSSVAFRAGQPFSLRASIFRHPFYNLLQIEVADEYLSGEDAPAAAAEYTVELARALPAFAYGGASADLNVPDFYVARDLAFLPDCFSYIGWYHLVSPLGYADYFDPEDLRALPSHDLKELSLGWFAITSYADPFQFADEASRLKIVELTEYLNERRKDWKDPSTD